MGQSGTVVRRLGSVTRASSSGTFGCLLHLVRRAVPIGAVCVGRTGNRRSRGRPFRNSSASMMGSVVAEVCRGLVTSGVASRRTGTCVVAVRPLGSFRRLVRRL